MRYKVSIMSKLIVMVGLPGSGKSYRARELQRIINAEIISSDAIRKELLKNENDQSNNELVFKTLYNRIRELLNQGRNAILDATNTSLKVRLHVMEEVKECKCEKIAYIMTTSVEECIKRDCERERTVGEDVIRKFERSFQSPHKCEGWDNIIFDNLSSFSLEYFLALREEMNEYIQHNPHHVYTLGEHCRRVSFPYDENSPEYEAAYWHDVGKMFTRKFDDNGVAHYYNHDSVGAYWLMSHPNVIDFLGIPNSYDFFADILFFVTYHMKAHRDIAPGTKAEKKYRRIFGDELYERLIQFAEYDKIASGTYKTRKKADDSKNEKQSNELWL